MLNKIAFAMSLLLLAACETAEGFGRDVQSGGQAIEDVSNDVQDEL